MVLCQCELQLETSATRAKLTQLLFKIYTKQSSWERPTEPVYPPSGEDGGAPPGPPPGYSGGPAGRLSSEKVGLHSSNPYGGNPGSNTSDERLARQLQEEENHRTTTRGQADNYYSGAGGAAGAGASYPAGAPQDTGKRGLFSKLLGGGSSSKHSYGGQPQYMPQQSFRPPQQQFFPGQQPGYGGGYPPQQGYYGGGGYGQPQYAQQRQGGGGMGMGGAAALGIGGGLLGGMMLGEAMDGVSLKPYSVTDTLG